jgi:hypothetical protein
MMRRHGQLRARKFVGVGYSTIMTRLEKVVLFSGAAFAVLASLGLHLFGVYFPPSPPVLTKYAHSGELVEIRLNLETCAPDGVFAKTQFNCDFPYVGQRQPWINLWSFRGPKRGSTKAEINDGTNAPPDDVDAMSLWGIVLKFDDAGHLTYNGEQIGTVQLTTRGLRMEELPR